MTIYCVLYARRLRSAGVYIHVNKNGLPPYMIEISPHFAMETENVQKKQDLISEPYENIYLDDNKDIK